MKRIISVCLLIILIVIMFFHFNLGNETKKSNTENKEYYEIFIKEKQKDKVSNEIIEDKEENDKINNETLEHKKNQNQKPNKVKDIEIVGWLKIPNTSIDYPVVQGDNNKYYLNHNVNHEKDKSGSIFMDYRNRNKVLNRNTIIYGHFMKNKTMFHDLHKFKDKEIFFNNNMISFDTLTNEYSWEVFSVYVTKTDFYYIQPDFEDAKLYEEFLKTIKEKSIYQSDINLSKNDIVLTLSTCTYEYKDARFVVHAKLIR